MLLDEKMFFFFLLKKLGWMILQVGWLERYKTNESNVVFILFTYVAG